MSSNRQRILLAGATGYIGQAVAERLVKHGFDVTALVRPAADAVPGCRTVHCELTEAAVRDSALAGDQFDAVISCIASRSGSPEDAWRVDRDANLALLALARSAGVNHFVLLSAICVQKPRLAFQFAKLEFERALMQSGLTWSIVRPTAYFRSLSGQIDRILAGKPFLIFGDGRLTACKPVDRDDLAEFLVGCLADPATQNQTLPIGGPGPALTAREQGALLFEVAGKPARFRSVSPNILKLVAAVLNPLGRLFPTLAAKAEFARIGHYYATESMLVWDPQAEHYDADATPETGKTTLRDHYERLITDGETGHEAREHKLF